MNFSDCKRIQIWTLGGAGLLPEGVCSPDTCNFINQYDLIARAVLANDYRLLIVRDENGSRGHDFTANTLAEEDAIIRGMDFGIEYDFYKNGKFDEYKKRLEELSNTKIIYREKGPDVQHAFEDIHYQEKLKELISQINGRD